MGAPQLAVSVFALMRSARHNRHEAALVLALCMLLGWLATVPRFVQHGLADPVAG